VKAYLLAAGEGTRLGQLTRTIPKCLVPIKGKPLLHYWLRLCERYGISDLLINLHHLPHLLEQFLGSAPYSLKARTFYEEKLLGSAGTILANAGVYIASPDIFDYIPKREVVDLGFDVLPRLAGKMYGYLIREYLLDVGTWENYKKAQKEFPGEIEA